MRMAKFISVNGAALESKGTPGMAKAVKAPAKPKPKAKGKQKTIPLPLSALAAPLALLALGVLFVLAMIVLLVRQPGADEERAAAPAPAVAQAPVEQPCSGAPSAANAQNTTLVSNPGGAKAKDAKPAEPPARKAAELDEFKFPAHTEAQAAERMKDIIKYLQGGSATEKRAAYQALLALGDKAQGVLPAAIRSAPAAVLGPLADAALELNVRGAAPALAERISKDGTKAGHAPVQVLAKMRVPESRKAALKLVQSSELQLREWGWEALSYCAVLDDQKLLFTALEKGEAYQRKWAIPGLARLGSDPAAQDQFIQAAQEALKKAEGPARLPYLQLLARLPLNKSEFLLASLLYDKDPAVCIVAIEGLSQNSAGIRRVEQIFDEELRKTHGQQKDVLTACLRAFASQPSLELVPKLIPLVRTADLGTRVAAHDALVETFGEDFGYHLEAWTTWIDLGKKSGDPDRRKAFEKRRQEVAQARTRELLVQSGRPL